MKLILQLSWTLIPLSIEVYWTTCTHLVSILPISKNAATPCTGNLRWNACQLLKSQLSTAQVLYLHTCRTLHIDMHLFLLPCVPETSLGHLPGLHLGIGRPSLRSILLKLRKESNRNSDWCPLPKVGELAQTQNKEQPYHLCLHTWKVSSLFLSYL